MSENRFKAHPTALVTSTNIGDGTRIWAFCNVQDGSVIGADCNICDHCFVENRVRIGDRVTIKNSVSLYEGLTLEDDVFVGPNAVFTNDLLPRSKVYHDQVVTTLIKQGATIGANATIVAGHTVGEYALIGAGAVVTKNIPAYTKWYGNPAKQAGYVCRCAQSLNFIDNAATCECGLTYRIENAGVVAT